MSELMYQESSFTGRTKPTPKGMAEFQAEISDAVEPALMEYIKELPKTAKEMVKAHFLGSLGLVPNGKGKYTVQRTWDSDGNTFHSLIQAAMTKMVDKEIEKMVAKEWEKIVQSDNFKMSLENAVRHRVQDKLRTISYSFGDKINEKWDRAFNAMCQKSVDDAAVAACKSKDEKDMFGQQIDFYDPESFIKPVMQKLLELCLKVGAVDPNTLEVSA